MSKTPGSARKSSSSATRVVVTGLGIVSPIGVGIDAFWKNALAGRSGITAIPGFEGLPLDGYRSQVAGQVLDFDPGRLPPAAHADRLDRYAQLALVATQEALEDAGLRMERENPYRVGVILGAGMGGMLIGEEEFTKLYRTLKPNRVHPNFIPMITLNSASGIVAIVFGAKGVNQTISTACSSSAHAIGQALMSIRCGQADVVIAGGADASLTPMTFAGFCALRALSTSFNHAPARASRPFDRGRDGFVMGEGAGTLILESLAHARKRKARIYAEVAGYGATSEAYHMVIPKDDGSEMAMTMALALQDAGISPAQVEHLNAHATATPIGDPVEVTAIRRLFKAGADRIAVNATKSMIGHTLGAAGAIGGIASVLALSTGLVHPTVNYDDPDPACELGGISTDVQERPLGVALLNAFGFGSNNAVVVFRKSPVTAARPRVR
ncbi:MAG TPA: beta-ketoacyl-ACP synthase II [Methylomirabilota bacterium]|jgi:3-oxoacyl-[acyl-carrier-protein] synthase II|nr:beta-ketoacyl-ACP synthase II [Methylomirabilota bacterium]